MNLKHIKKANHLSFLIMLVGLLFITGCSGLSPVKDLGKPTGAAYGTVTDTKNSSLENANVSLIGMSNYTTTTDKNGQYSVTEIPDGIYRLVVEKTGYRSNEKSMLAFMVYGGGEHNLNVTLYKDCDYYIPNTVVNYVVKYGYNVTLYDGDVTFIMPYPDGATYKSSPDFSEANTFYKAGNRMLRWSINNSEGQYPSAQGNIIFEMKGTKTMKLLERKEMKISAAALSQQKYLGKETDEREQRAMIDPTDKEIRALAQKIKSETGSDDAWTVANALYVWVKNNIVYHTDPQSDYTQSAIEVLHSGKGDCDEIAFLYISLCRAAGIPARFVTGYWINFKPDGGYVGHAWAEFYYGEWAPVELTELWNSGNEPINSADMFMLNRDNAMFFAVDRPDHIATFIDDGTSESMGGSSLIMSRSYGQKPSYTTYTYYNSEESDQMYIAYCADGTRRLVKEME